MSIDLTSPRHEGYRIHPDSGLFGAVIRGRPRHERIRDFDGTLMDKTAYLASVDSEMLDPERIVSESMKVHLYGTVAVVNGVYRENGTKNEKPYMLRERFTDTWVRRNDSWICGASHSRLTSR
jgi:hypothetical protein